MKNVGLFREKCDILFFPLLPADNGTKGLEPTQPGGECWGFDGVSGHGDEDDDEGGDKHE